MILTSLYGRNTCVVTLEQEPMFVGLTSTRSLDTFRCDCLPCSVVRTFGGLAYFRESYDQNLLIAYGDNLFDLSLTNWLTDVRR